MLALGLALGVTTTVGRALPRVDAPGRALLAHVSGAPQRVEADPQKDYPITPAAGPWLICAASYSGPEASALARQFVYQVRAKYNLPAYVFNHTDEERRRQRDELERIQAMYPEQYAGRHRTIRVEEQCAVLVGGYPDMDKARAALDGIKKLPAPEIRRQNGELEVQYIKIWGEKDEKDKVDRREMGRAAVNPFSHSFVVRNPAIPQAVPQKPKFDPFWEKLNAEEDYSLLKAPGAYTLVVKVYQGVSVVRERSWSESILDKFGLAGNQPGDLLGASALQAHEVAKLLSDPQRFNLKAYVFHTREASIVTVGSFKSPDDPDVERTRRQLASLKFQTQQGTDPIGLMNPPKLMEVPRP
jgi:hypothetical protein